MKRALGFLTLLMLLCSPLYAAPPVQEEIDRVAQECLEKFNVPGLAVGIVIDGKVVHAKGYGTRSLDGLPVTEKTLFAIASCTKAFTTHLLAQLVEEGKVAWDDPVVKHLPEFQLGCKKVTPHVTIRDLVAHRTGLPRHDALWYYSDLSRKDVFDRLKHLEPTSGLREKFQYNNILYSVAAMVYEKAAGLTWEKALHSRIFKPLKMTHSNSSLEEVRAAKDYSFPHAELNQVSMTIPFHPIKAVRPGGGINSNVVDMTKWLQEQMSKKELLSKQTYQEMHSEHITFGLSADEKAPYQGMGYGLGWYLGSYRGHSLVHHGGSTKGFISELAFLPEKNVGIVVLTNSGNTGYFAAEAIRDAFFDIYLGIEPEEEPIHPIQDYLGIYQHPAYGPVHVSMKEEQLIATFGKEVFPLTPSRIHVFTTHIQDLPYYGVHPEIEISFSPKDGKISELQIPFETFRAADPITFKKTR